MFAINKKTQRRIAEVEVVDTLCVEDFVTAGCNDLDGDPLISPAWYDDPNPVVISGTDDSGEQCEARDIVLVETLPVGYDEDGEWCGDCQLEESPDEDTNSVVR